VAVIGVEDQEFGQRLRAFVVVRDGQPLTAEDLREFVRQNLARYKVPRDVVFVQELPRNPTGKILKRALPRGPRRHGAGRSRRGRRAYSSARSLD
jgi:fatty-acyl-CoA synthase